MPQDFYFLLMPGFSAIGFISAIEPLRVANRFRGELYRWHVLSADGGAVLASNGMSVNADEGLAPLKKGTTLLVVAGFEPLEFVTPALEHWLRRLDHDGVTLGAIDTGSFVLAQATTLVVLGLNAGCSKPADAPTHQVSASQPFYRQLHVRHLPLPHVTHLPIHTQP